MRERRGPCLLRLTVPRLEGHSFQDTQTYKSGAGRRRPNGRAIRCRSCGASRSGADSTRANGRRIADEANARGRAGARTSRSAARSRPGRTTGMSSPTTSCRPKGGQWRAATCRRAAPRARAREGQRINMVTAIRRTLEHELAVNPRVVLFGEDVGPKGGVHAVTLGLQEKFGDERACSTPACRKKASSAAPSAWRWRGSCPCPRFSSANMPIRRPNRSTIAARCAGGPTTASPRLWWCACRSASSNAAIPGTARPTRCSSSMRRAGRWRCPQRRRCGGPAAHGAARQRPGRSSSSIARCWMRPRRGAPYPGDDYRAAVRAGAHRAGGQRPHDRDLGRDGRALRRGGRRDVRWRFIDLRTLMPWDRDAVLESVKRTRRCLIVHEDLEHGGLRRRDRGGRRGSRLSSISMRRSRAWPCRTSRARTIPQLLEWALPSVESIQSKIEAADRILSDGDRDRRSRRTGRHQGRRQDVAQTTQ